VKAYEKSNLYAQKPHFWHKRRPQKSFLEKITKIEKFT
jgi:hypothetical protein